MLVQKVVCELNLLRLQAHQAADLNGGRHRVAAGRGDALTGADLQTCSDSNEAHLAEELNGDGRCVVAGRSDAHHHRVRAPQRQRLLRPARACAGS